MDNENNVTVEALTAEDEAMLDEVINASDVKEAVITSDAIKEGSIKDIKKEEANENNEQEITLEDIQRSDLLEESTGEIYSREEATNLFEIINRVKAGEKFSIYNALIPSLQKQIQAVAAANGATSKKAVATYADMAIGDLIKNTSINKEWAMMQSQLKNANKMPQHMDIYGEALFKNMVDNMLFNSFKALDKGEENNASVMQRVAKTYMDMYYFKPVIEAIINNQSRARKYNKHVNRSIDDLDYRLPRLGVSMSHTTRIATLAKHLRENIGVDKANRLITAYAIMLNSVLDESSFTKERALLCHQFLCVLTYIDMEDSESQTEFGKKLLENLEIFNKQYDLIVNHKLENGEITDEFNNLIRECSEAYDKKYSEMKEAYDNDIDIINSERERVNKEIEEMRKDADLDGDKEVESSEEDKKE